MTNHTLPPVHAERFLALLLTPENRDAVLGDFAELYQESTRTGSFQTARTWYWMQVIKSSPALLQLKLSTILERSFTTMNSKTGMHNKMSLITGLVALLPALMLIIPGLLQSAGYIGLNDMRDDMFARWPALQLLLSPFVLLGGLLIAFVLNVIPAMKFRFEHQPEGMVSVITLRPVLLHWLFVGASVLIVGIILVYAFFENFNPAFH